MTLITNKYHSVWLDYDEELLAWLQEAYPFSNYHTEEIADVDVV